MESFVIQHFWHLLFFLTHEQYAFRSTSSTTAALISLLQVVTDLLSNNLYVAIIALDFSKAFDIVRHPHYSSGRAYFNVPTGTDVFGDLKSVLEDLVTRA